MQSYPLLIMLKESGRQSNEVDADGLGAETASQEPGSLKRPRAGPEKAMLECARRLVRQERPEQSEGCVRSRGAGGGAQMTVLSGETKRQRRRCGAEASGERRGRARKRWRAGAGARRTTRLPGVKRCRWFSPDAALGQIWAVFIFA